MTEPPPFFQHGGDLVFHAVKHAREVDVDDLIPAVQRVVGRGRLRATNAGVVARHIQTAIVGHRAVDQRLAIRRLAHIGRDKNGICPGGTHQGGGFLARLHIHV